MKSKTIVLWLVIGFVVISSIFAISSILSNNSNTGKVIDTENSNWDKITLQVAIPCGGHAGLISSSLKTIDGVEAVKYRSFGLFDVYYNSSKTSKEKILQLNVFKEYSAKLV